MGRPKKYYEWELPKSVVEVVRGVCADYERRENAIKFSSITGPVLNRYIELNGAVDEALCDIMPNMQREILRDVAENIGYDFSQCSNFVSRKTYFLKKRKFIHDVAEKLFLIPK